MEPARSGGGAYDLDEHLVIQEADHAQLAVQIGCYWRTHVVVVNQPAIERGPKASAPNFSRHRVVVRPIGRLHQFGGIVSSGVEMGFCASPDISHKPDHTAEGGVRIGRIAEQVGNSCTQNGGELLQCSG